MVQAKAVVQMDKAGKPTKDYEKERHCCWNSLQNWKHWLASALESLQVVQNSQPPRKSSKCKYEPESKEP